MPAAAAVGAHPPGGARGKGSDQGSDGEILWRDGEKRLQKAVVSVKGGRQVTDAQLKDLLATLESERAAVAGEYELAGTTAKFPRVQILTVEELLAGQRPDLPRSSRIEGHRQAKVVADGGQGELDFGVTT